MPSLQDTIARLAQQFASQVLTAIRTASLDDITAVAGGRTRTSVAAAPTAQPRAAAGARNVRAASGGRRRRSKDDIDALGGRIVSLLGSHSTGLRAEQIRTELNVPRKELPRALAAIVDSGAARKEGQKRATTYFATGSSGGGATRSRAAKRGGAKKGARRRGKKAAA